MNNRIFNYIAVLTLFSIIITSVLNINMDESNKIYYIVTCIMTGFTVIILSIFATYIICSLLYNEDKNEDDEDDDDE